MTDLPPVADPRRPTLLFLCNTNVTAAEALRRVEELRQVLPLFNINVLSSEIRDVVYIPPLAPAVAQPGYPREVS